MWITRLVIIRIRITHQDLLILKWYRISMPRIGIKPVEWWPSKEEYEPGLTVEQWIEVLQDSEVTTDKNLKMFAMMIDHGKPAACSELAEKYVNRNFKHQFLVSLKHFFIKKPPIQAASCVTVYNYMVKYFLCNIVQEDIRE